MLDQPIVFTTNEEVQEAVKLGVLKNDYGYNEKYGNRAPVVFWKNGATISHQPNEDEEDSNIWSEHPYIKILQKSVLWKKIRNNYSVCAPDPVSFVDFLKETNCFEKYLNNCKTENQRWSNPQSYYDSISNIKKFSPKNWIIDAFNWEYSEQGHEYWHSIDNEWCAKINGKKIEDIVWK
jgi:hypothetical protein